MTQQVYNLDWYASNETVKYPLDSLASCIPTGYDYVPQELLGVITDISFNISNSYTGCPYLAALSITNDLLSLIICVKNIVDDIEVIEPLFAFSSTQKSLYTNRYYTLTSFSEGCSGVIVFGEAAKTHRCVYKFSSEEQARFLPAVYHRYLSYPIISIGKKDGASSYRGDIMFKGEGDVKVEAVQKTPTRGEITFSLNNPTETLQKYIGACDGRPESGTCLRTSIEKINTVAPDEDGNIIIKGAGINIVSVDGSLVLSTDYVVDDVCVKNKMRELIGEDTCCDNCQKAGEDELQRGCEGKVKSINFSKDVLGEGIEIDYRGVTAINSEVSLVVDKLTDVKYCSLIVSRPEAGGFCQITYGAGREIVKIKATEVEWERTISLLDVDTHTYPNWITFTVDHCNGVETLSGSGVIKEENSNLEAVSVNILFKGCTIKQIGYKKDIALEEEEE